VADLAGVFGVSGQFGAEGAVFQEGPGDQRCNGDCRRDQAEGGANNQRRAENPEACPKIARVSDNRVGARGDDPVVAVTLR